MEKNNQRVATRGMITRVNGVAILTSENEMIPIKPICEALGVAFEPQFKKLKEDEDLGSVVTLGVTTGADGKAYGVGACTPRNVGLFFVFIGLGFLVENSNLFV